MMCPVCGEEMVALMLDVGYAKWFCPDCDTNYAPGCGFWGRDSA